MTSTPIGSGHPLFSLPGGRFDQVTLEPLQRLSGAPITKQKDDSDERTSSAGRTAAR